MITKKCESKWLATINGANSLEEVVRRSVKHKSPVKYTIIENIEKKEEKIRTFSDFYKSKEKNKGLVLNSKN